MNKDVRNNNIIKYFQEGGQKRRKCPEGMRWSKKKNTCVDTLGKKVGIETKAEKAGLIGVLTGLGTAVGLVKRDIKNNGK